MNPIKRTIGNLGLLILRSAPCVSLIALHGASKLGDPGGFIQLLVAKGFVMPHVLGYLSIASETLFPLLIILGLGTRFFSLISAVNMFVAAFVFHLVIKGDAFQSAEKAFIYMVVFLFIALTGGGDIALDRYITIKRKKGGA